MTTEQITTDRAS